MLSDNWTTTPFMLPAAVPVAPIGPLGAITGLPPTIQGPYPRVRAWPCKHVTGRLTLSLMLQRRLSPHTACFWPAAMLTAPHLARAPPNDITHRPSRCR
jgi:hypothetical protein